ncbi:hypothetical protein B0A55_00662 [Friedmanniomyces simplex]|uniref:Zn(2)-C6 fungal-type domain-containing protein n=1 Tax=Friedmanniomyces simplex TaxID=329884 RepID=A0A4U0Y6F8_9PEZI|nr:hypothetical protein B0A55_00662 [Friedmanniomyces simplex]
MNINNHAPWSSTTCEPLDGALQSTGKDTHGGDEVEASKRFDTPFEEIPPSGDLSDGEEEDIIGDFATKYALRPQTRATNQGFLCTWIDQDDTGDFDPGEEQRRVRAQRCKVRLRQRQGYATALEDGDDILLSDETLPSEIPTLITELRIASEAGKAALRNCLSKRPAQKQLSHDAFSDGYHLRTRTIPKSFLNNERRKDKQEDDLSNDLTGHPAARGCWACLKLGLHCPLLDDEHAWPCHTCSDDDTECDLVTPLDRKRASDDDCTACEMAGNICIPEQTTTPPKATITTPAPPQKRRLAAAERTQEENSTKRPKRAPRKAKAEVQQASPSTPTTITTKLCHPIIFNNETTNGTTHCDFCDGSSTAILGLEQKEVQVIDRQDGRGLTEVSGGHMADGHPSTRVCTACTMQRMLVIMCSKHELRPIPGAEKQVLDADGALTALFSGKTRKKDRWCSICPALAMYECETAGAADAFGKNLGKGCGLQLCETCMPSLAGVYDGDLQAMLGELTDDLSAERPLGLRADFELLKQDGLLTRCVLWANEQ